MAGFAETAETVFRFGGFTLDIRKGLLERQGAPVFLRPKAHALLEHLARNMGRLVPKSELMDVVWPGVFVTEDSLTQSIREIRRSLGDELIRTVSRRGYMLAAETETLSAPPTKVQLAVLRFRNDSGAPGDDALVEGFADDLINGLCRFGTFSVLSRNSSFRFASYRPADWPEIQSRIGADYLVEGSLRRRDGRYAVAVNLVDSGSGAHVWGERFEAEGAGVFAIQQEIVEQIVARLVARVHQAGVARAASRPMTSLAAYELNLKGLMLVRDPARSDLVEAGRLFQAAIDRDPAFGLAYANLALTLTIGGEFGRTDEVALRNARDLADRGAMLSPDQATCRRIQSLVCIYMREHRTAEAHLRLGLDLNPNDAECIEQMGFLLSMRGRPVDALAWFDRGLRIDPLNPLWHHYDRALAHYLMGDYALAVRGLELSTHPTPWIRTRLAACLAQLGDHGRARAEMDLALRDDPGFSPLDYARRDIPFEHRADAEHFAEGVALALGV